MYYYDVDFCVNMYAFHALFFSFFLMTKLSESPIAQYKFHVCVVVCVCVGGGGVRACVRLC